MIDKALNENHNSESVHSFYLNTDPNENSQNDEIADRVSSSISARKAEENNKVLADTRALLAELKFSLDAGENDQ